MSKKQINKTEEPKAPAAPPAVAQPKAVVAMTAKGFAPTTMEEAWRLSEALSSSGLVPDAYKGKPRDCLIALDLAGRLGVGWLAIMQSVYSVHGRLGMESKLVASLINTSGIFTDPLDYEVVGDDSDKDNYKVRAFATRKSTGKVLYGPWITWKLVRAEAWDSKAGSKWKTMPDQMFHYRAASWFANRHCPEVKIGMMTTEEAEELPAKHVESTDVTPGVEGLKARLTERNGADTTSEPETTGPENTEDGNSEQHEDDAPPAAERDAETEAKVAEQKAKLGVGAGNGKKAALFR